MLKLLQPKPEWRTLILANDSPRLALEFAPHVNQVNLVCPTTKQAQEVEKAAATVHLSNIVCDIGDPEFLPYDADTFDLVVSHHMAHTWYDTEEWLRNAGRILRPRSMMAIVSYLVPGTRLRGKKARKLRDAADYLNAFTQLRNPRHQRYYSQNGWEDLLAGAGYDIQQCETTDVFFAFAQWAGDASLSRNDRLRLKAMIIQAPEKAREFLTPQFSGDRIQFRLPEITILATSKGNTD